MDGLIYVVFGLFNLWQWIGAHKWVTWINRITLARTHSNMYCAIVSDVICRYGVFLAAIGLSIGVLRLIASKRPLWFYADEAKRDKDNAGFLGILIALFVACILSVL